MEEDLGVGLKVPFEANIERIGKKEFNCSYLDEISLQGLFLRSKVPVFQKSIASNYVTIKKIFSYTVVQPRVTNVEYSKMRELGFVSLESLSAQKAYDELMCVLDWANGADILLREAAREIFEIRVKELKFIFANTSKAKLMELEGGYLVYDKYLEFIAG